MALTKERIDEIFAEISGYKIELEADPSVLGASYLQSQIAICRNYTNNVATHLARIHRERMGIDATLRRKETAFKIASDELLASNAQVRNLPNIADRQAQINIVLRDEHREIEELKNDVREFDHLEKMIKLVHRELKDTMAEIKTQRGLVRDELDSGSMYGDERKSVYTGDRSPEKPMLDDLDEQEIASLLSGESTLPDPLSNSTEGDVGEMPVEGNIQPVVEAPAAPTRQAISSEEFDDFLAEA